MNAVIYARFSYSRQREESIEGQIRECRAYAERKGLTVVNVYADRAISGTSDKRPEFQKMIADAASGAFDAVLCWKHDRFARNRRDAAVYKQKLASCGVSLLYAAEEIPDGPSGIILDSVMEGFAEYYSANLSQNVKRGLYESALKRQTLGVRVLGYSEDENKRYVLNDDAPVVRRIFEDYASGKPAAVIVRELNEAGVKTVRGRPFGRSTLRYLLTNPKYYGLYAYADIVDETAIPPIVSKALWDRVQDMVAEHHELPARKIYDGGFLLTGRLFCGECGEHMIAASGTGRGGRRYDYYVCDGVKNKKNGCPLPACRKKPLEDKILQTLRDLVFSDEFIESAVSYFMEWQGENTAAREMAAIEARIRQNETATANLIRALASGFSQAIRDELDRLEKERGTLKRELVEFKAEHPWFSEEQIRAFLLDFRRGDMDDPHWRVYLVRSFLKAAYVFCDKVVLHLNISGKDENITLDVIKEALVQFPRCPVGQVREIRTIALGGFLAYVANEAAIVKK